MDSAVTIPVLIVLIVVVTVAIGVIRQRGTDMTTSRGSLPGKGHHTLESQYNSGLGGHNATWKVPRDPQEYARTFVPQKDRWKDDSRLD